MKLAVIALALLSLGAVWRPLSFTAPARARAYELQRSYDDSTWFAATLYNAPNGTVAVTPGPAGSLEQLWVLVSESFDVWSIAGGTRFRLRASNAAGAGPWSNIALKGAGPDTEWVYVSRSGKTPQRIVIMGRYPEVSLALDDTLGARLTHLEEVQYGSANRIMSLYGRIALRGRYWTDPEAAFGRRPVDNP